MLEWTVDPELRSALIALIGVIISLITSIVLTSRNLKAEADRQRTALNEQASEKSRDLKAQADLKKQELEAFTTRLRVEQESLRQGQLTEILKERSETYPALYEIISVYGRNWEIEGKARDRAWVELFLQALINNNAKNGAFFSERVYRWYGFLQTFLEILARALSIGREATDAEIALLYDIIRGPMLPKPYPQAPGLGSFIKDELVHQGVNNYIASMLN